MDIKNKLIKYIFDMNKKIFFDTNIKRNKVIKMLLKYNIIYYVYKNI